jgi:DNA-directed RNA polymerase specialized sigma24 family protein
VPGKGPAGESGALGDVVRDLNPLLWYVARSEGLTADQASDVVQTTWLELLRRLHQIRSPEALTAWLVTTTRRGSWYARDQLRRQSHDGMDIVESDPDPGPDVDEGLVSGAPCTCASTLRRPTWTNGSGSSSPSRTSTATSK